MDDATAPELPEPQAVEHRRMRVSKVWILPALAAMIALSLFFERVAREGPEVVVTFASAGGIVPGTTQVRYKDVAIGLVTAVDLSPDFHGAEVKARITRQAAPLMTDGASFWIVRPRVTLGGISGLDTLLSGNYIAFERGEADHPRRRFTGLENASVVAPDAPGRAFVLLSRDAAKIDAGMPVYFQGLDVGKVVSRDLAPGGGVEARIFVDAPYDRYVHDSTRFWNASGIDLTLRGSRMSLKTESLTSILVGGIAFDAHTPDGAEAPAGSRFTLYRDRDSAMKSDDSHAPRYAVLFDEPVDGIEPGSPVLLLGVAAGEVKRVGLVLDPRTRRIRGRLEITFAPERALEGAERGDARALMRSLVTQRGLRAQLRTASLLTGQRYVAFDYFPHPAPAAVDWSAAAPTLPAVPSLVPAFEEKVARLLDKLDAVPLAEAVADARKLMREAEGAVAAAKVLAVDVDREAVPGFAAAMREARQALESAKRTLDGASSTLVGPDAPGQRDLLAALAEMTRAARALRTLSDSIERHPESLIWGRSTSRDSP